MKIKAYTLTILLMALLTGRAFPAGAQEKTDSVTELTPALTLNYLCLSNDSVLLTANISVRRESGIFNLENAEIEFSAKSGDNTVSLGKAKASSFGDAILKAPVNCGLTRSKDGMVQFMASFAGKGKYLPVTASFSAKPAKLVVALNTEDSVRYINVSAFQTEPNGEQKPLAKEKVTVYIPRLYSLLKIGEVSLDENGTGKIEYPGNLIGDSTGVIKIIARIEESETFGNVQGFSSADWGIPKHLVTPEKFTRELWTPIAPVWMIITLIIMLAGVWAHYIFAVIQLVKIKRLSKEKKTYF
jgi:hypothetical protein